MTERWRQTRVKASDSISDVIRVINTCGLRIALVVDDSDRLLGTVTDGDVRRGLMNDIPLAEVVAKIMNINPITANFQTSNDTVKKILEKNSILSIPLINNGGVVLDLFDLYTQEKEKSHYQNPVFIMAGGFGTRLSPLTDNCPKPMLKIGGKPILETILNSFIESGFVNFYISTHYKSEMITDYFGSGSKWGVNIDYVHEMSPLGTGGALGRLPKNLTELPIMMINGDIMTNANFGRLLDYHVDNQAKATVCVREYTYTIPYGVIEGEGMMISSITEKPDVSFHVNAGIYVLDGNLINSVSDDEIITMPEILENLIKDGEQVVKYPLHEYWLDIGRISDFERAGKDFPNL